MFPGFPHTFTPKKCKKIMKNLIYNKTPYVHLTILPNLKKKFTIPNGADGDILQAWKCVTAKIYPVEVQISRFPIWVFKLNFCFLYFRLSKHIASIEGYTFLKA